MTSNDRVSVYLPLAAHEVCNRLAKERGLTKSGVMRQALGILQAAHDAAKEGYHVGIAESRENLRTILIAF